jgi:vacuolar-type H+-ATPase subunit F/Vma7
MIPIKQVHIAIVGDEDLVNALRLAGVSRYYIIKESLHIVEDVHTALSNLIDEPDIGIVGIQEDYVKYVEDLIAQLKEGKRLTPVIIELPSKYGTKYVDVAKHYKEYIRKCIGFDIEI